MSKSKLEQKLILILSGNDLPLPVAEFRFHPERKWRFDFAYVEQKIAVELEGAIWIGGRHCRGAGMLKDMEKYNTAVKMGWRVLRYSTNNINDAVKDIAEMLKGEKP